MHPNIAFKCSIASHEEQTANYMCKDQQCIQHNPICTLCAFTTHKQHQLEPLKLAIYRIEQDSQGFKQNLVLLAKIDVLKQKLYQACQKITDLDIKKLVKLSIDHYVNLILSKIKVENQINFQNGQQRKISQKQLIEIVVKNQKKYLAQSIQQQKGNNQSNYCRLLKKIAEEVSQTVVIFQQMVKKGQIDQSTCQIFAIQNTTSKKFKFSSKNKHQKIQITEDNIAKMPDQYVSYNYFVLCDPKLSLTKVQTITFHMVSLTSYVTLGICNLDKIAKNYQFNTGQTSHGSYQISFDGYSWGDTNNINSQYTSWYYNQGDKVTLQFNPQIQGNLLQTWSIYKIILNQYRYSKLICRKIQQDQGDYIMQVFFLEFCSSQS